MITAEQAKAIATSVSGKTKIDITAWKVSKEKTVDDIIRAEASQGNWRVSIVVDKHHSDRVIGRLLQCHYFSTLQSTNLVCGIPLATILVSWISPREWAEQVIKRYLKD